MKFDNNFALYCLTPNEKVSAGFTIGQTSATDRNWDRGRFGFDVVYDMIV